MGAEEVRAWLSANVPRERWPSGDTAEGFALHRTWERKLREALMSIALEMRYDKTEIMDAYVNEIYLGQDGARAVHGFGLASQFYFGKPLAELELHEMALLVAIVRGPTYYDPRRHPDRARERRNFVLQRMADEGLATSKAVQSAAEHDLGLVDNTRRSATQSAFLALVRRQLSSEYQQDDLERKGLDIRRAPHIERVVRVQPVDDLPRRREVGQRNHKGARCRQVGLLQN